MMRTTKTVNAWLAGFVALSCGGACSVADVDGGRADAAGFVLCTPGGTFDINGTFGVLGLLNVHVSASGLVEIDTTSELLILMDMSHVGTDVSVVTKTCAVDIPDVPLAGQSLPIVFEVPAQTLESVAGISGSAVLSSPNENCASFSSEQFTVVLGAKLDPPDSADLPSADENGVFPTCSPSPETSCVSAAGANCACDQEQDGKPGVTVRAANVPIVDLDEVYATVRTQFTLAGFILNSDEGIGLIEASIEQGFLACQLDTGKACTNGQVQSARQLNPEITLDPDNLSTYRSVRVPDTMTCAELIQQKNELFPL